MRVLSLKVVGDSGMVHSVTIDSLGVPRCSCPAFRHGDGSPCKHMRYVAERLTLEVK